MAQEILSRRAAAQPLRHRSAPPHARPTAKPAGRRARLACLSMPGEGVRAPARWVVMSRTTVLSICLDLDPGCSPQAALKQRHRHRWSLTKARRDVGADQRRGSARPVVERLLGPDGGGGMIAGLSSTEAARCLAAPRPHRARLGREGPAATDRALDQDGLAGTGLAGESVQSAPRANES